MVRYSTVLIGLAASAWAAIAGDTVYFQAHRGGLDEVPENTLAAMRHAWAIEGAVPEVDVRTTKDGKLIVLHDATLARTTDAPDPVRTTPVRELTFEQVRACDAGVRFDARYRGERVPALEEILDEMLRQPGRQVYLDIKDASFEQVIALITQRGIEGRVIFVHGEPKRCAELRRLAPKAGTMTWLSGSPERIRSRYEELKNENFNGLTQLQFHLHTKNDDPSAEFVLDDAFLRQAMNETRASGVALQIRPFTLDPGCLRRLLDLGVRWFVADAPAAFNEAVRSARTP